MHAQQIAVKPAIVSAFTEPADAQTSRFAPLRCAPLSTHIRSNQLNLSDLVMTATMQAQEAALNRVAADALWTRCATLEAEVKRLNALLYPPRPYVLQDVMDAAAFHFTAMRTMLENLPAYIDGKEGAHDALDDAQWHFEQMAPMSDADIAEMLEMSDAERKNDAARDDELMERLADLGGSV